MCDKCVTLDTFCILFLFVHGNVTHAKIFSWKNPSKLHDKLFYKFLEKKFINKLIQKFLNIFFSQIFKWYIKELLNLSVCARTWSKNCIVLTLYTSSEIFWKCWTFYNAAGTEGFIKKFINIYIYIYTYSSEIGRNIPWEIVKKFLEKSFQKFRGKFLQKFHEDFLLKFQGKLYEKLPRKLIQKVLLDFFRNSQNNSFRNSRRVLSGNFRNKIIRNSYRINLMIF